MKHKKHKIQGGQEGSDRRLRCFCGAVEKKQLESTKTLGFGFISQAKRLARNSVENSEGLCLCVCVCVKSC